MQISVEDAGTGAYPIGDGLNRSDIEEFREAIGDEPLIWWHDCTQGKNTVIRSPIEAG